MREKIWDVFISHASEDKDSIVRELAKKLTSQGVSVWYDEFALKIGDSLSRSIDKGLANSNYGLIILSPDFLKKDWPEYELRGLTAKELGHEKVILPIWHNINREEILKYSPSLADKCAIISDTCNMEDIINKIIETVRPDLFEKIMRRIAYDESLVTVTINDLDKLKIMAPPIIHEKLPEDLIIRIRLIRSALLSVYPHSMEFWIEGFKRDAHPTQEVFWWEHLCCCFLEYVQMQPMTIKQYESTYKILIALLNNVGENIVEEDIKIITREGYKKLCNIIQHNYPYYDIEEEPSKELSKVIIPDFEEYKKKIAAETFE